MSLWTADVAIIKIKPELQQDFAYFFNAEYDKIKDEKFKTSVDEMTYDENHYGRDIFWPIRKWSHQNEKKEWEGKYKTSYQNGILTYGVSFNEYNIVRECIWEIEEFIEDYCAGEIIFRDGWTEPM